ncbi:class I SAM-dependent RNA methyltransferase [Myxococcota bacterium]|nr:class I SAM-dependent RNA methyltransferase [Myxococcota bacterium]MBU1380221.1 class I SAM-dependent RNA methyltransferase [Myxococcota bacterium]MBU1499087.1 class I SAM-dependent RNA methyltransferase [Myxococcota bacterium]
MLKSFEYQRKKSFFAQVATGLEEVAKTELLAQDCSDLKDGYRGVEFSCDVFRIFELNYTSRVMSRILAPLHSFSIKSEEDLYKQALEIPWDRIINDGRTFLLSVSGKSDVIANSRYGLYKVKDAICDFFTSRGRKRPEVNENPDVFINVFMYRNSVTISLDTSGESLHHRGYKTKNTRAPLAETLAAGILALSGWDGKKDLLDPMCGSGTLLTEAQMIASNIPAGYYRKKWGFECMSEYNHSRFEDFRTKLNEKIVESECVLIGSDIDPGAVSAARANAGAVLGGDEIRFSVADFHNRKNFEGGFIVTNPPYGERMENENIEELYKDIGDFFKLKCKQSSAFLFTCNLGALKKVGLKTAFRKILWNGQLEGRLCRYDLY